MSPKTLTIDKLPTIRRLPNYLQILRVLSVRGEEFVSSAYLAEQMGIEAILVRKDLELTGVSGTPRVGFSVPDLIRSIEDFLGWRGTLDACLVGVGHLGRALLAHRDLSRCGVRIVAAFDTDESKIGIAVHGVSIFSTTRLPDLLKSLHIRLAIVCVPAESAQQVTDLLIQSGIKAIWIFTSATIKAPPHIIFQKEDLLSGLAVLSAQLTRSVQNTGS